jgi:hypothetical protein
MPMFREKSKRVEARQWTGSRQNFDALVDWLGYAWAGVIDDNLLIENRSGRVIARIEDWIVHEDDGFYPVEPIKFWAEYEAV